MTHTLSVSPQSITECEAHAEVHFFCRENNGNFAINIVWQDPHHNIYIPGSVPEGRISAEGSRFSIFSIIRNDAGNYRCHRSSDHTEFAEGRLTVTGMQLKF